MEALECIKTRRSVRKFKEEKINRETVNAIIEAAQLSPSWKNTQICRFNIVENEDIKSAIAADCCLGFAHNAEIINGAPQLAVISYATKRCGYERDGSFTTSKEDRWEMFDAGIVTQTFCLAAHEMGVGTVIMGIFDDAKVANTINLPEGETVAVLVAMGYPNEECATPKRKELADVARYM